MGSSSKRTMRTVIAIQMAVLITAVLLSLAFSGVKAAYSSGLGGLIGVITTGYFAYRVLILAGPGSTANQIARAFYVAEIIKIVLTGALFTVVLLWLNVSHLPLFLTYGATMMAYWLALPLL